MKENEPNTSQKKTEPQEPDFLLIDEREGRQRCTYFGKKIPFWKKGWLFLRSLFDSLTDDTKTSCKQEANQAESPQKVSLRFVSFLGWLFCFIFGLGMLLWSLLMSLFSLFSLFCNSSLNQATLHFWKLFFNTLIAGIGFTIGLIFPTIGLKFVALYFAFFTNRSKATAAEAQNSETKNEMDEDLLKKTLRHFLNRAERNP